MEKPEAAKKTPVVVVRSGKLSPKIIRLEKESLTPEIIRLEKESLEVHNEENIEPVFQEAGSVVEKELVKSFEEVMGEIDKEIKKYDSKSFVSPSFGDSTGKENYVGQPRINEANVLCTSTLSAHLSLSPRAPLAEIPNHLVNHGYAEGTWKRINRVGVVADAAISEAVG
nr:hypothetical protein CFP56_18828 [Quercus suber]